MKLFLYDPRYHLKTETTFQEAASYAGISMRAVYICKCKKRKLKGTNCYLIDEKTTQPQLRAWYESEKYRDEQFKPAFGEPRLLVSNYGRVKRVDVTPERFLLPTHTSGSNKRSTQIRVVWKTGAKRSFYQLSRLVVGAFLGECLPGKVVVHKNGLDYDFHLGNLVVMTEAEHGKSRYKKTGRKPVVQIDPETMKAIDEFRSVKDAAEANHIVRQSIGQACKYGRMAAGYRFMYKKDYIEKYGEIGGEEYAG